MKKYFWNLLFLFLFSSMTFARDSELKLNMILYPNSTFPVIVKKGDKFDIEISSETDKDCCWTVTLEDEFSTNTLSVVKKVYDAVNKRLTLSADVPLSVPDSFYNLHIIPLHPPSPPFNKGGIQEGFGFDDINENAVKIISEYPTSFYLIHETDNHLSKNDCRTSRPAEILRKHIKQINIINPEFMIFTGDNTACWGDGCENAYKCLVDVISELEVPAFFVPGNHDHDSGIDHWYEYHGYKRYYTFDFSNLHFLGLDTGIVHSPPEKWSLVEKDPTQLEWVNNDLNTVNKNSILFYHMGVNETASFIEKQPLLMMILYGHTHINGCLLTNNCIQINTAAGYYDPNSQYFNMGGHFRLIRMENEKVKSYAIEDIPCGTIEIKDEEKLNVDYSPANDSSSTNIKATITNEINERFEHGKLRFNMKPGSENYFVHNGKITRLERTSSTTVIFTEVDILPLTKTEVTVNSNPVDFTIPQNNDLIGNSVKAVPFFYSGFVPSKVTFYFDEQLIKAVHSEPFDATIETLNYQNGKHKIKMVAEGKDGNRYESEIDVFKAVTTIQSNQWSMISLPWQPESQDLSTIFGTPLPDIFRYSEYNFSYRYCYITDSCFGTLDKQGIGFWIYNNNGYNLEIEPDGKMYYRDFYKIQLLNSWNQIGSPYLDIVTAENIKVDYRNNIVPLKEADDKGWISGTIWEYNDGKYTTQSSDSLILEPFKSYWLKVIDEEAIISLWIYKPKE